jgi:hypothetical protein
MNISIDAPEAYLFGPYQRPPAAAHPRIPTSHLHDGRCFTLADNFLKKNSYSPQARLSCCT